MLAIRWRGPLTPAQAVTSGRLIDVCLMLEAGVELEVRPHFAARLASFCRSCGDTRARVWVWVWVWVWAAMVSLYTP